VKNEPEAGLLETAPQLPRTDAAENVTKAPGSPASVVLAVTVISAGQVSVHPAVPVSETLTEEVDELLLVFGSLVVLATVAVLEIGVPAGVPGITCKDISKDTEAPRARVGMVQVIVPVLPGVGATQPADGVIETKVVFAGTTSVSTTFWAASGPLL